MPLAQPKPKHIHKLKRHNYKSGSAVFFCALDCTFKCNIPLALGKKTICWRCEQPFDMNEYSLRLAKPHCPDCHKPKKADTTSEESPTSEILPGVLGSPLSLAERLNRTIQQAKEVDEEDI